MCPSYPRHRRSLGQSFLDNPQLLFQRSVPLSCGRLSVSVHHCSTWTLSLAVHVASMTSNYTIVHTARAGRLRLSLRYASAPDCQALIQSRKRQLKPSRAQEQKQAGSRVYSPEPTYVRPTTCSPTRSRFESPRKGIGKSKPFACTADARKAVHLT